MQDCHSEYRKLVANRVFDKCVKNVFAKTIEANEDIFDDVPLIEMFIQEEQACLFDLAFKSPIVSNWRKFTMARATLFLPQACREHFVAERTLHPLLEHRNKFARYYRAFLLQGVERLETFECMRNMFLYDIFTEFEGNLLGNAFEKNIGERKVLVRKYLDASMVFRIDRFVEKFDFMIQLCTNPPLDSDLTVDVLKTLCDSDMKKMCSIVYMSSDVCLVNLLRHAAHRRFDFWGLWRGIGDLSAGYNFLPFFISGGKSNSFSRILLQYGFPYPSDRGVYKKRCRSLQTIRFQNGSIMAPHGLTILRNHKNRIRMMLVLDTFTSTVNLHLSEPVHEKLKTLVYLTRSLPDPYVTPAELYYSLKDVLQPDFSEELRRASRWYGAIKVLDGDYGMFMPRKLRHLCRCVIRRRLADNFRLLSGIKELEIPEELQAYLALER